MLTLRAATDEDLPALNALVEKSVRGLSAGVYTQEQIDASLTHVFGIDTQLIADGTYFLVEADGQIVAAGGWSARRVLFGGDQAKTGPDDRLDPRVHAARIRAFFVHPDHSRQGLARRLFAHCATDAQDAGFRRLELVSTLPGVPLYEALGFARRGEVDVAMPNGLVLKCVHMERHL